MKKVMFGTTLGAVLLTAGCTSSQPAAAPVDTSRCGPLLVGLHDHVGDTRTYLQTSSGKRTTYATQFEGAQGEEFSFHRIESDGVTVDDTYRVNACAVILPRDRQTVADGRTITISGLRIPRLADASRPVSSKARVRVEDGDRAVELPVAFTVHARGVKRVTVPAGTFETRRVDLRYVIMFGTKAFVEKAHYYLASGVGPVETDIYVSADGVKQPKVHSELTKITRGT